jgi:hypothetical protein
VQAASFSTLRRILPEASEHHQKALTVVTAILKCLSVQWPTMAALGRLSVWLWRKTTFLILEEPQQPFKREIRILNLSPGVRQDVVICDLRVVDLDEKPEYEALSYVWGETKDGKNIVVSGHPVVITSNLYDALVRLRLPTKKRTLWVDQLCINQWDIDEKATQVALMRDIYQNCTHCILWLGEIPYGPENSGFRENHTEAVFDFIRLLGAPSGPNLAALWEPDMHQSCICANGTPTLFCDGINGILARRAFVTFAMYGNPWWQRIWTLQESALPNSADYVWGSHSVSREDVIRTVQRLRGEELGSFPPEFQHHRKLYTPLLRRLFYPVHGILHFRKGDDGAMDLCMRWRHRQATDPRDKIYALLGLLPAHVLPSAQPCSYSVPTSLLSANVTLDLIWSENDLRALVASSELVQVTPELPTWAIDFACSNTIGPRQLKWWNHTYRYQQFAACGKHALYIEAGADNRNIALTGVLFDEVSEVNKVYFAPENETLDASRLSEAITNAKSLLHKHQWTIRNPYGQFGQLRQSALWRTMIGDLVMDEFPIERAKVTHEEDFDALSKVLDGGELTFNILYESLCGMVPNHAFFITKMGYIGLGLLWRKSTVHYATKQPPRITVRIPGVATCRRCLRTWHHGR